MAAISFEIKKELPGMLGRAGELTTPHGSIQTPAFVGVGTKATIKSLTPLQLQRIGLQIIICNTYHLYLEPGDEVVRGAGGLHNFMNWSGPLMTDSGGFQVFSLGAAYGRTISKVTKGEDEPLLSGAHPKHNGIPRLVSIEREGVMFRSHTDGNAHYFTPEKSIEIQHNLGADIIFAFDECISPTEPRAYQREALDRTHNWARKSLTFHKQSGKGTMQGLFGIVQGGRDEELRRESAKTIGAMDFDGFGIGGSFAIGDMETAVRWSNELLPPERPRHLLGIGEPEDLFMGIENGVDLFDCVSPTRIARGGMLYTNHGKINLLNAKYTRNFERITRDESDPLCPYTYAYMAHLFRSNEMLGIVLASTHNLYFIANLVRLARRAILEGRFEQYRNVFLNAYKT